MANKQDIQQRLAELAKTNPRLAGIGAVILSDLEDGDYEDGDHYCYGDKTCPICGSKMCCECWNSRFDATHLDWRECYHAGRDQRGPVEYDGICQSCFDRLREKTLKQDNVPQS